MWHQSRDEYVESLENKKGKKRGNVESFIGIILSVTDIQYPKPKTVVASDDAKPKKTRTTFTKVPWAIVEFTNIANDIPIDQLMSTSRIQTLYGPTDVIAKDGTRRVCGKLPFIQQNVVYHLKVQETLGDSKYGWSWIIQSCKTTPMYSNPQSMKAFVMQFGVKLYQGEDQQQPQQETSEVEAKERDKMVEKLKRRITKDIKTFVETRVETTNSHHNIPPSDWNTWLASTDYGQGVLRFVDLMDDRNFLNESSDFDSFPCITFAYNVQSLFIDNSWWDELSATLKSFWEQQLKDVHTAFPMTIRFLMPTELQLLHKEPSEEEQKETDDDTVDTYDASFDKAVQELEQDMAKLNIEPNMVENHNSPVEEEEEENNENQPVSRVEVEYFKENPFSSDDPPPLPMAKRPSKRKSLNQTGEIQKEWKLLLTEFLKFLRLDSFQGLNYASEVSSVVTTNAKQKQKRFHYIPEINLRTFKALCKWKKWNAEPPVANAFGLIDPDYCYVPELRGYFQALETYEYIHTHLVKENQCGIAEEMIPLALRDGLELLMKRKVLDSIMMPPIEQQYRRWWLPEEHDKKEDKSTYVKYYYLYRWAELNRYMMKYFKSFEDHNTTNWHIDMDLLKNKEMWSEEQLRVLEYVQKYPIFCVNGSAGYGKSSVIQLFDQCTPGNSVIVSSFTGKATGNVQKRMTEGHVQCHTIHTLKNMREYCSGESVMDLLVLEECSMSSKLLIMELLTVVKVNQIIMIGDVDQIPPFSSLRGSFFRQMLRLYPNLPLTINYRQLKDPDNLILPNLNHIIHNRFDQIKWDRTSFMIRPFEQGLKQAIIEHAPSEFQQCVFLCATNDDRKMINEQCVIALHPDHQYKGNREYVLNTFFVNDDIMILKNTNRFPSRDRLDTYFNCQYYYKTYKFTESIFQNAADPEPKVLPDKKSHYRLRLAQNGQCGRIVEMFRIRDQTKLEAVLKRYYLERLQDQKEWKKKRMLENKRKRPADYVDSDNDIGRYIFDAQKYRKQWQHYIVPLAQVTRCLNKNEQVNHDYTTVIRLDTGQYLFLNTSFSHAYSCTLEKYQGSEKHTVYLCMKDFMDRFFLRQTMCRNKLYTGGSRAQNKLVYLGKSSSEIKFMMENVKYIVCGLSYFLEQ